jgi:hypothetical protein
VTDHYWVQAAPFRALLCRLIDLTGLPWPVVARYAGVSPAVVRRLLYGRAGHAYGRIPSDCARRLLALDENQLQQLARLWYR